MMEFVLVCHAGNSKDPIWRWGHVPYDFEIGKYPVTNQDYAEFLNAVARKGDPFCLYHGCLSSGLFGGIDAANREGQRCFTAKAGWEQRPVVYINWYDLARLANWYHYGRPDRGVSELGTTEGTDREGAYDTRCFPETLDARTFFWKLPGKRNQGARYWIPNEDEWVKAGHYDPEKEGDRKYWDYAVRTDKIPGNQCLPDDPHAANYFRGVFSIGKPYFLSEVGAYRKAKSYFGTYDQGGNVWEWLENWRYKKGTAWGKWIGRLRKEEWVRGLKGGSATYSEIGLHLKNTDPGNPSHKKFVWGGRLARQLTMNKER
ncbi:MAG: SUMF1/EgtB/PvdO family nonheme iron enzyme [Candidatus Omnitrophica bacterium]|nr:SUMF1/EgtB/PvdO family nonheme iron enzyme [Candidatus Omnitrophota bacterium]